MHALSFTHSLSLLTAQNHDDDALLVDLFQIVLLPRSETTPSPPQTTRSNRRPARLVVRAASAPDRDATDAPAAFTAVR